MFTETVTTKPDIPCTQHAKSSDDNALLLLPQLRQNPTAESFYNQHKLCISFSGVCKNTFSSSVSE